ASQPGVDPKRILILEAGDNGTNAEQRDEFHRNYLDDSKNRSWFGPYSKLASRTKAPFPTVISPADETYYDQDVSAGPNFFKGYYVRAVGGSTWAWRGNTPRLLANDFRMHSTYQVCDDWPLTYGELEADYHQAEVALGVSGDHGEWEELHGTRRHAPFPM